MRTGSAGRRFVLGCLTGCGLLWGAAGRAEAPAMPEQPPAIVVGEVFQFVEGAWAEYDMLDRTRGEEYVFRISMLEEQRVRRWRSFWRSRPYQWMEIAVAMPDKPRVVVKCLARITDEGPGELHEAIIQIQDYENPIRLKRRWLRGEQNPVAGREVPWSDHRSDEREIHHAGHAFPGWRTVAEDADGRKMEAVVSLHLPPLGLYMADTPDLRMSLRDFGMGATSEITGTPLGLTRWILRQVRVNMAEADGG